MNLMEERLRWQELAEILSKEWAIEKFLENPARSSDIETRVCVRFLKRCFPIIFSVHIEEVLLENNHNLVIAAIQLNRWNGLRRKVVRPKARKVEVHPRSITNFIIEASYIKNRREIKEYISKNEERRRDYKGELLTCCCCFEEDLLPEAMSSCKDGHPFCETCIKRGAEVALSNGKTRYTCFSEDCKAEFCLVKLEGILASKVLRKLVQNLQTEEINAAGIKGLETCPSCPYAAIPDPEDRIFKCLNPDCMRVTCRKCKRKAHQPLKCEEVGNTQTRMRTYIENKMTEALVRTCWDCKKTFIKEGGCNKMTCTCGAMMCYLCRQPVESYSHFNQHPEMISSNKCPLFSDDKKINFNAIKSEAIKAKKEVMSKNPNVKLVHDPTLLLQRKKK